MAVPRNRQSLSKSKSRRTHYKKKISSLIICKNCGTYAIPHSVCMKCGFYKNQQVINVEKKDRN